MCIGEGLAWLIGVARLMVVCTFGLLYIPLSWVELEISCLFNTDKKRLSQHWLSSCLFNRNVPRAK